MPEALAIAPLRPCHAEALTALWLRQFQRFLADSPVYPFWAEAPQTVASIIAARAEKAQGVIALQNGAPAGFMAYETFSFHGADSAFIPFTGHAAPGGAREAAYWHMYRALAERWVADGIKSHYITCAFGDDETVKTFFDLGFGAYVGDAFARPRPYGPGADGGVAVRRAQAADVESLCSLVRKTGPFYAGSPIFLTREEYPPERVAALVAHGRVLLALCGGRPAGFLNLSVYEGPDGPALRRKGFGTIDEIGAYLLPEYRNRGVGRRLVYAAFALCVAEGIPCVHVDYETANGYANRFWPKYFSPTLLSLRRAVHADR